MKLQARDIGTFLKQPDQQTKAVLLYGPDGGLVRERSRTIVTTILGQNYDPLNKIELTGDQVKSDPAILLDELSALSLMGGRRLIVLRDANEKIVPAIESAFDNIKTSTYLIIEADELSTSSSLRKLFEKEEYFASVACYLEEGRDLEDMIRRTLGNHGLKISHDATLYLVDNLGNDKGITLSELEKIALYMGEEKEVTLQVATLLTGNNSAESMDDLCHAITAGNSSESHKLLALLLHEGTQPVVIIRSLIRYFQRLDIAHAHIRAGQSPTNAIKMLRPPVFYKSVPIIERALIRTNYQKIANCLNMLLKAEKELKSSVLPPPLLASNIVQQVTRIAA